YRDALPLHNVAEVRTISHENKIHDREPEGMFDEYIAFLRDGTVPTRFLDDDGMRHNFVQRADHFILHDGRLWRKAGTNLPRLVISDKTRRKDLIAQAHNDCGH
ncbi:hypothetical protein WOLCODRAFT_67942, partial [Wolfiporia cocos MD-104 SS10]